MQAANQSLATNESSRTNGQTHLDDFFVLTDEQILEIEPEAQDVTISLSEDVAEGASPVGVSTGAIGSESTSLKQAEPNAQSTQARVPALAEPPAWLAETMNDPQRGAEARALWDGAQRAEREAASFREVFAKPEEARAAAERARALDDIDRAYFAGDASQRAQLAATMMREDPAAFREMVFAGLRALEAAEQPGRTRSIASAAAATLGSPAAGSSTSRPGGAGPALPAPLNNGAQQSGDTTQQRNHAEHQAQLAAYATFEKAANDDLERSVGGAIERTLAQALPTLTGGGASSVGAQHAAPLQARLSVAIRQDIEKALQGDRQLGEQVAQILAAKRLDHETRAQVVRLIGERAQQLVPSAAKRALNDWTQTTLAAHRGKSAGADTRSTRREVSSAVTMAAPRDSQAHSAQRQDAGRSARTEGKETSRGRVDYRKLNDDQILDL